MSTTQLTDSIIVAIFSATWLSSRLLLGQFLFPMNARIIALAGVYDVLKSKR